MRSQLITALAVLTLTLGVNPGFAADPVKNYESGYKATMKLGADLYKSLDPKFKSQIHVHPISLETDVEPFVRPVEYPDDSRPLRMVFISVGFVDLMNNVAHAKAINKIEKGYFEKYILTLSHEEGHMSLKEIPGLNDPKYWTEDIINEQLSNFNQMVGMCLAIDLSHHYLGHFKKYEQKLNSEASKGVPINNLLTEKEWEQSLKVGIFNAIESGLGVDGVKALYETIGKMPTRPAWTAFFLPKNVDVPKLLKTLDKYEKGYFKGDKFL